MPKQIKPEELDALVAEIARHPDGLTLSEIRAQPSEKPLPRTLQRRLAVLIEQGRIERIGTGRAVRYRPRPEAGALSLEGHAPAVEIYVPISPEGAEIKVHVRKPIQERRPVGFAAEFLEGYRPNETAYLPEPLRRQLHRMGRSPAHETPAGTFARDILNRLMIDLAWSSSRLEGNTYSRLETERLIELGQAVAGKDALEAQMILNHKAAIEYLVFDAAGRPLEARTIKALHALLSDGLLPDPQGSGQLRDHVVEIGASVYRPMAVPQRIEECFGRVVETAAKIKDPFEVAFFLLVQLPYLQPFGDVNKRTSRLAANHPLIRANLCPLSFIDVPEKAYVDGLIGVYELNRIELLRDVFVWAYERSCQQYVAVRGEMVPPDRLRLRYRAELGECIKAIVRQGLPISPGAIEQVVPPTVSEHDRRLFCELVERELAALHADNAIRFGLGPLEFLAWKSR